ncbi:helix-turn-helix domain-containing protein [Muricomes intestini]|jgi:transcriptional regulator with XRE-family HTH domain|uniref:Transcriptional regulator n=1 Tax=Muricomes intestini TaxID=1796634 RepID=A0A4R3K4C4_9FIRM|nr:helix-turn-helix transcriptional regulator [Muricomes intestini]TCS77527.1 transcriptional regulator [Muricomes intestini]HAX50382.1 XRE family transcriptional regulator [Lachnospiraceae bacterium]HCR84715.1 XRE family transcriptional regulator [Lachnospiraceae bacterium]
MFSEFKFPKEIAKDIALQEKRKRKRRKLTQAELSERAGISLASLKRFEQTGEISFVSLIKIADILGEKEAFGKLFTSKEYQSIQEVIDERNQ